jgi:hypothetical protein
MNIQKVTQEYRLNQWIGIIGECRKRGQNIASWYEGRRINPKRCLFLMSVEMQGNPSVPEPDLQQVGNYRRKKFNGSVQSY